MSPLTILFDLDGTLTDPEPGITNSIRYALRELGCVDQSAEALRWCIGPPLYESFATLLATDDPVLVDKAVALYRERYAAIGRFENSPYPGIPACLAELQAQGATLFLATSKLLSSAQDILEHFGLVHFFMRLYGSGNDGALSNKVELVRYLLDGENIDPASAWMVGDRLHDVIAGKANGLRTVGVTYGYGGRDELCTAGADILVEAPVELKHTLFLHS
jgi:phosphoglycolate phosphatase